MQRHPKFTGLELIATDTQNRTLPIVFVLQNTQFPGVNNGIWEHELAADFLMGCRAGLWGMDESKLTVGLILTNGSPTHPEGTLRVLFIRYGKYKAIEM